MRIAKGSVYNKITLFISSDIDGTISDNFYNIKTYITNTYDNVIPEIGKYTVAYDYGFAMPTLSPNIVDSKYDLSFVLGKDHNGDDDSTMMDLFSKTYNGQEYFPNYAFLQVKFLDAGLDVIYQSDVKKIILLPSM